MNQSPEFHDARVVIVGAPGSGRADLLHGVARRCGGTRVERLDGGVWKLLRSEVASQGLSIDVCCLDGECAYHGVQSALVATADGVIVMIDVSPQRLMASRRAFEAVRPTLDHWGGPWLVQYHRVEQEPKFHSGKLDDWLELEPGRSTALPTVSESPDVPGGAFDRLVESVVGPPLVG